MHAPDQFARRENAINFLYERINYEQSGCLPYRSRDFKLDRMRRLLDEIGNPEQTQRIIHIAGTKGKGSTAAFVAEVLRCAGFRVGVFTSPHLERLEERFVVDGRPCSATDLADLVDRIKPAAGRMDHAAAGEASQRVTYFELTTAMALLLFQLRSVDFTVLEVGLGGRLDSTNVCQPLVTAITSISFDHTKQLGNTLAAIAGEKAGILKPGVPVVSGVRAAEARRVVEERAEQLGCSCRMVDRDFFGRFHWADGSTRTGRAAHAIRGSQLDYWEADGLQEGALSRLTLGIHGPHQAINAAVAVAIIRELQRLDWAIPETAIRTGLSQARCAARIEVVSDSPTVVLDTAHNVASAAALVETLQGGFSHRRRRLIFSGSRDKDVRGMLDVLLPHFDQLVCTQFTSNPRAVSVEQLAEWAGEWRSGGDQRSLEILCFENPREAWRHVSAGADAADLICVAGSFFLAAELRGELGNRSPERASQDGISSTTRE